MVAISKPIAALVTILPTLSSAWVIGLYSTQNSCGGEGGADANAAQGEAGVGVGCTLLGVFDIQAIRVTDWDDGCDIVIHKQNDCSDAPLITYKKDSNWPTEGSFTCISDQRAALAEAWTFSYTCA
jgi:hypothetical protein